MPLLQLLAMLSPDVNVKVRVCDCDNFPHAFTLPQEIASVGGCAPLHLCVLAAFVPGLTFLLDNGARSVQLQLFRLQLPRPAVPLILPVISASDICQ
jgi:hypothetical protein